MNKLIKFTVCAILALLIVSLVHGEPLAARQYGDDPVVTTPPDASKTKLPIPDATPTDSVDTFSADTTYGAPSGAPSGASFGSPSAPPVPGYTPSGTGSLISQWASLTAKGVPANPTAAPATTAPAKAAETPSSANKFESGLINVAIIAGIMMSYHQKALTSKLKNTDTFSSIEARDVEIPSLDVSYHDESNEV
ncbi:hypothetical protein C1646_813172 [Rhizophagus diaphanus]|nr:hypothetical protein C1646_813172 [Rhizophagus diaphanus] [Rhizophagus sp. MUCL 43196]